MSIKFLHGRLTVATTTVLSTLAGLGTYPAVAQVPIGEPEAHEIGIAAYTYLYPLVTMDVTRLQLTNMPPGVEPAHGPANMFVNVGEFPTANMKTVVRPNFDTLYSLAYLDLAKEPMVVSAPDTAGRYYMLPMLDMWTDVFASPGSRTTGTMAGTFLVAPAGWKPELRDHLEAVGLPANAQRIDAPTPFVWIIGRTKTDGPSDYDAVHKVQAGFKVTPLSEWGQPLRAVPVTVDPRIDLKTPPKMQVDAMSAGAFFAYGAELMKLNPPHPTDQPILALMRRIGIEQGKSFDLTKADPIIGRALATTPEESRQLMAWKMPTVAKIVNGWSMNTDTMGVYGNYYLKRAIVTNLGLGANLPEDAIYPLNLADELGKPLDGAATYTIRFPKDGKPPINAFWSVTLYDADGYQVANALDRFAVSSWMPFQEEPDGSLKLYVQNASPGADKEANWLPAPKSGPFSLTMRLYSPQSAALTGKWEPPAVIKASTAALP